MFSRWIFRGLIVLRPNVGPWLFICGDLRRSRHNKRVSHNSFHLGVCQAGLALGAGGETCKFVSRCSTEAQGADGLALYTAKAKGPVVHPARHNKASQSYGLAAALCLASVVVMFTLKPGLELRLGPVAARDEKQATRPNQSQYASAIPVAQPPTALVSLRAQADGVESAFVEDYVPARAVPVEDGGEGPGDDVPLTKRRGLGARGAGRGDLVRERDALRAVVDAQRGADPAVVAQREEQGAVAAAEVEKGGVLAG